MPLKPYHNPQEVQNIVSNKFNPSDYALMSNPYSAAIMYFKNHGGETAVKIFENIVRDDYRGRAITERDLIEIAKKMQKRGYLIKEDVRKQWIPHISQIANARIGGGDPLVGYLKSFGSVYV